LTKHRHCLRRRPTGSERHRARGGDVVAAGGGRPSAVAKLTVAFALAAIVTVKLNAVVPELPSVWLTSLIVTAGTPTSRFADALSPYRLRSR